VRLNKELKRSQLIPFIANLSPCLIGLEACGGAHHWTRVFSHFGHTVKMIAPQNDRTSVCKALCEVE
jgi:transposase